VVPESDLVMDPNQALPLLRTFPSIMEISPQRAIMVQDSDLAMDIKGLQVLEIVLSIMGI
jgi:hypothetical protein